MLFSRGYFHHSIVMLGGGGVGRSADYDFTNFSVIESTFALQNSHVTEQSGVCKNTIFAI